MISYYAVRCLFSHPSRAKKNGKNLYEERITLWKAKVEKEAYAMAELEAKTYASEADAIFVEATDAFHLFDDKVVEGTEVWSVMRDSKESKNDYIDKFILTGEERIHEC